MGATSPGYLRSKALPLNALPSRHRLALAMLLLLREECQIPRSRSGLGLSQHSRKRGTIRQVLHTCLVKALLVWVQNPTKLILQCFQHPAALPIIPFRKNRS
jgi:hypothetical protein